ncbi:MAG: hypothetical protein J1F66_01905 [Clostridiales bacterium]|nr:hypothetical protein [Clostridiales bacterium]
MEIWSCAFLGQSKFNYELYQDKVLNKVEFLIQRGVTHFYNCYRNSFDALCAAAVDKLRENYPDIKNILVLAHKPEGDFVLPECFDEAVYLLDNDVPLRFAVRNTWRKLVRSVDFVISGVKRRLSGAKADYNYAKRTLKSMYDVVTDKSQFWLDISPIQIEMRLKSTKKDYKTTKNTDC